MLTDGQILITTLVIYLLGMVLVIKYDKKLMALVSILWFVPVFIINNPIIQLFSVIMFIYHIVIAYFNNEKENDFD